VTIHEQVFWRRYWKHSVMHINTYPDPEALARGAADLFVELAAAAVAARGLFTVALAGGTTPSAMYRLLASEEYAARVDWSSVYLFWGDERCVPPDDPASNYRMARETLLDHVPIPTEHIFRIKGELPPELAAREHEQELRTFFTRHGLRDVCGPKFDLILLGIGDEGHTASLFPGSVVLHDQVRWVVAVDVAADPPRRITLTPLVINAAAQVAFLVAGAQKADILHTVFTTPPHPDQYPAQLIAPVHGQLSWLLDAAAAARLGK